VWGCQHGGTLSWITRTARPGSGSASQQMAYHPKPDFLASREAARDQSEEPSKWAIVTGTESTDGQVVPEVASEGRVAVVTADGSCIRNPGPGGWAATVVRGGKYKEVSGAERHTTNNRMELRAVIEGLRLLEPSSRVRVITDSRYVRNGITLWLAEWKSHGWRRISAGYPEQEVANRDLWQELDSVASRHDIRWEWIRGHSGHPGNSRCHQLALEAARGADRSHRS
jgi:ribonuclease HI